MNATTRYFRIMLTLFITLLCVYLIGQLREFFHDIWIVLKAVLLPFLAAMVVTYVLQPVVELLVRRRVPRAIAILIIYLLFLLLVVIMVMNAIPMVARQITQLSIHLPELTKQADAWIDDVIRQKAYLPDAVRSGVESAISQAEKNIAAYAARTITVITGAVSTIFIAFIVPFLVFYMLKDARAIGRAMMTLSPRARRAQVKDILTGIDDTLGRYVRGQLLIMLSVGLLTYAGLLVVHMPYALLLALFLAAMDIIPYIGPFIGAAPALILALSIGPSMAIKVLIVNIIVQQAEGNFISPQIMGRTLDLHPMAIVAALLLGGEVGGVLGLVAAVPVLAVSKVIWQHVVSPKPEAE